MFITFYVFPLFSSLFGPQCLCTFSSHIQSFLWKQILITVCNKKFKGTLSLYCFWQFHFFFLLNLCLPLVFIAQDKLKELTGPGKWEQWTHWKSKTQDHKNRGATKGELEKILSAEKVRKISYYKPTFEKIILWKSGKIRKNISCHKLDIEYHQHRFIDHRLGL